MIIIELLALDMLNPNTTRFVHFALICGIYCLSIVLSRCLWPSTGETFQTLAILL